MIDLLILLAAFTMVAAICFLAGSRWQISRQAPRSHPPRQLTIQERIDALKPEIKPRKESA